jgi:TRL (tRNA-associated locus)-like protein
MQSFRTLFLAVPLLTGCIYSHITTPLDLDLDRTHLGDKVGTAEWQSVLGLVAWGDAGTQAAAKQGGLTQINHADLETLVILAIVYHRETTILYGE